METFRAGVQYNDVTGSSAADRSDHIDISEFLRGKHLIGERERVAGVDMYVMEPREGDETPVGVTFIVVEVEDGQTILEAIQSRASRKVRSDLSYNEFFSLFKRFNVTLSPGSRLEGREF